MTELQELLLAAKAAGIEVEPCTCSDPKWPLRIRGKSGTRAHWNPSINDGDAFKLAIDLGIQIHVEGSGESEAVWADDTMVWVDSEHAHGDRRKAARTAIVSVAAQRGEQMP
ncbi:hypothetical protein CCOS865_02169 [Pseudomonas reidholzensis]|uniref:Phage protein n=1 Tax=Pseudomonas reidholzensis TaxID=1785162 RepID=A0A383RSY7_9PSED|nr:hypothetical protein [Pseudomonas reidholzensis]SYX89903.1 hypothetical protein CCOS865_02169 [Pseudomonas reidholzensis]